MNNAQPKTGSEAIEQRDAGYGGFYNVAETKQAILHVLRSGPKFDGLDNVQVTALEEIAGKLARIVNGEPKLDNWVDIAGYAELVPQHSPKIASLIPVPPPPPKRGGR